MEGPSLFLAAEQLAPFVGCRILAVSGNTKIGKERLEKEKIISIFSWGKYLFIQFKTFALRTHFLLFGSYRAVVNEKAVTGDYPPKAREPRLALTLKNGHIEMHSCSLRFIESPHAQELCDYSIDIMSDLWDPKKALNKLRKHPEEEIDDILLDQTIFMGVGNIIKNEALLLANILPTHKIADLSTHKQKQIVQFAREHALNFYHWRKDFELKKHYQIYRQSNCKQCGGKISRQRTGRTQRLSYICMHCQK